MLGKPWILVDMLMFNTNQPTKLSFQTAPGGFSVFWVRPNERRCISVYVMFLEMLQQSFCGVVPALSCWGTSVNWPK